MWVLVWLCGCGCGVSHGTCNGKSYSEEIGIDQDKCAEERAQCRLVLRNSHMGSMGEGSGDPGETGGFLLSRASVSLSVGRFSILSDYPSVRLSDNPLVLLFLAATSGFLIHCPISLLVKY